MLKVLIYTIGNGGIEQCALDNLKAREGCWNPGYCAEIFLIILNYMKIPYELIQYDDTLYGSFHNGSWTQGPFKELQDGNVDLIANFNPNSGVMMEKFEICYSILEIRWVLLINGPETDLTRSSAFLIDAFTKNIWYGLAVISLFFVTFFGIYMFWHKKKHQYESDIYEHVAKSKYKGIKVIWAIFGITLLFFSQLYQNLLLTFLLYEPIRDQWQAIQLIKEGKIKFLGFRDNDLAFVNIRDSKHPFYQHLREALKINPPVFENRNREFMDLFETGRYIMISTDNFVINYKKLFCNTQVIRTHGLPQYGESVIVRKGSTLKSKIDSAILRRYGEIEATVKRYRNRQKQIPCYDENPLYKDSYKDPRNGKISLRALIPAWTLFIVLVAIAFVVFCLENVIAYYCKKGREEIISISVSSNHKRVKRSASMLIRKLPTTDDHSRLMNPLLHNIVDFISNVQESGGLTQDQFAILTQKLDQPQFSNLFKYRLIEIDTETGNSGSKKGDGSSFELMISGIDVKRHQDPLNNKKSVHRYLSSAI